MNFEPITRAIRERMAKKKLHEDVIEEFLRRVQLVHGGCDGITPWNEIAVPERQDLIHMDLDPEETEDTGRDSINPEHLARLVVIKLNGGLGTSMGLSRAKSLIPVKENRNFLQIIQEQILSLRKRAGVEIPLLFMDSFNTTEDTLAQPGIRNINASTGLPADFLQNMVPRIRARDFMPVGDGSDPSDWCPPGHGDIYLSLHISGILDRLLERGFRVAFISNGDNLGATVNGEILDRFLSDRTEFAMEITQKTAADIKGGVLIRHNHDGVSRVELLEVAQVAADHVKDFQDTGRFPYFNTNSLWIDLEALRDHMRRGGLPLSLIVNPKDVAGESVLQLETAMGSAIGHFARAKGIVVGRDRFAPVKTCQDLLVRRSDRYILDPVNRTLVRNPAAPKEEVVVRLDGNYKMLDQFEALVRVPPSLVEAQELEVRGRVLFDRPVAIRGRVVLVNEGKDPVRISASGRDSFESGTHRLG